MQIYVNYIKVCDYVRNFILGPLFGFIMPTSLVWAQYVHPINIKIEHSFLLEEPGTHSDSSSIWSRKTLKNAKKTYPPAVNTYEYLTPASTCLNTPDHFFELSNISQFKYKLYDEFPNVFENTQVPHIHRKIESNFSSLDSKKSFGHLFVNPLPGSSYDFPTPLVPLENRDLKESKNYFSLIEPFAKPQNQKPSRLEKKGKKELKPFLAKYPNFSYVRSSYNLLDFNIFSLNFPETEFDEEAESFVRFVQSTRQRRADWNYSRVYSWEINDFDPSNTSANPIGAISSNPTPDQNLTRFSPLYPSIEPKLYEENPPDSGNFEQISVKLSIEANDGIGSLAVLAYGMTGGNALNDYTGTSGFHFMTATDWDDVNGDVTEHFTFETSGIDAWLNGFDPYNNPTDLWGVYKNGDDFYLTYEYSNLNFTPVPEPSTYFMTGILFCFIACNRASRNTIKTFFSKVFMRWKTKGHIEDVQNRIS